MATRPLRLPAVAVDGRRAGALGRAIALILVAVSIALASACSLGGGPPRAAQPTISPIGVPADSTARPTAVATSQVPPTTGPKPAEPTATPVSQGAASSIDSILAKAAAVRALPLESKVPVGTLDRNQLHAYLVGQFEEEHAKEDLQKDQAMMVLLDLLREGDDLHQLWLGLLSEQVVGFYEFASKEMKLVGSGGPLSPMDEVTLAHESVHALQDQHFDLGARLKRAESVGESGAALQALSEGDATLAMGAYARQNLSAEQLATLSQGVGPDQQKLQSAPPVLQVSLLFPYMQGTAFASALYQSGGWPAVDKAYASPPVTSEQILHPEKYVAGEGPASVRMPDLAAALAPDWSLWKDDVLGELGALIYLATGVPADKATAAAAGWGGDRTLLFRSKSGDRFAMAAVTAWDTPADAAEFFSALRDLRRANSGGTLAFPNDRRMTWTAPSRSGYAAISGNQVALVITPDGGTTSKIRGILEADVFRGP